MEELIKVLQTESKSAIDWFKMNDMIVNPDKFQPMIMICGKMRKQIWLKKNNSKIISSVDSVTLLGIKIGNQSNFGRHVLNIVSFFILLSRQYSLLYIYIYLYIVNIFKYLFILSEIKESYLYYYDIKILLFSLDFLLRSSSLPICCCKIIL